MDNETIFEGELLPLVEEQPLMVRFARMIVTGAAAFAASEIAGRMFDKIVAARQND